ncbi:unnamed protein product [Rangifer tarandus platyrhynchus]|uniref:Uncharacterized protein n=1 Tax=Rangifer tarandus platyrhynchus TaxID=3082113 RepID=A0ABN9A3P2_RANTA|nr:unnamed protein product [Rangifer tarandus platyrhynchus]
MEGMCKHQHCLQRLPNPSESGSRENVTLHFQQRCRVLFLGGPAVASAQPPPLAPSIWTVGLCADPDCLEVCKAALPSHPTKEHIISAPCGPQLCLGLSRNLHYLTSTFPPALKSYDSYMNHQAADDRSCLQEPAGGNLSASFSEGWGRAPLSGEFLKPSASRSRPPASVPASVLWGDSAHRVVVAGC